MSFPLATYRLQFTPQFRFDDAARIVPYLAHLGISHIYASPLFQARPGSQHGYDVTDPTRINDELGGETGLDMLVDVLHEHGLGLILDIVPNHMAADHHNPWWTETLALGPAARHARCFDIDWGDSDVITLPALGNALHQVLDAGELKLAFENGWWWWSYFGQRFPCSPESVQDLVALHCDGLQEALKEAPVPKGSMETLRALLERPEEMTGEQATEAWHFLRQAFNTAHTESQAVRRAIENMLRIWNNYVNDKNLRVAVERALGQQHYRLHFWRDGLAQINYRRFFDVAELAAVRSEDPTVFEWTHRPILDLVSSGKVQGLRVDHVDGLADPAGYLARLRAAYVQALQTAGAKAEDAFLVIEKILSGDERLPQSWPVEGMTGYVFMNRVNGLFVAPEGYRTLRQRYAEEGNRASLDSVAYRRQCDIIPRLFTAELKRLAETLSALAADSGRALAESEAADLLVHVSACLPVYRTYITTAGGSPDDRRYLLQAVEDLRRRRPDIPQDRLAWFAHLVLEAPPGLDENGARQNFVTRWQQFTGPAMAKGFEDTAEYDWFVLASLNEVGASHHPGPISLEEFHAWNGDRAGSYRGMNATSTHDTKRSEDVRARLNVLSEMPDTWAETRARWHDMNARYAGGEDTPDEGFESFLYQNLIGIWSPDADVGELSERLQAYALKAARERKRQTSWRAPDKNYEEALTNFVQRILDPADNAKFLEDFAAFCRNLTPWDHVNSLAQTVLKIAAPGLPDFYQGTEFYDRFLVDPDNRRPVDFDGRSKMLGEIDAELPPFTADTAGDDRYKMLVTARGLQYRKAHASLFTRGRYIPLYALPPYREHVAAFARELDGQWCVVLTQRFPYTLCESQNTSVNTAWEGGAIKLPDNAPDSWKNTLTQQDIKAKQKNLSTNECFARLPVALLTN